jgi:hypothetical protein
MRRVVLLFLLLAFMVTGSASADESHRFGIGVIIGSPTGLSAKLMLSQKMAIDAAVGEALIDGQGVQVHADFLLQPLSLYDEEDGVFSLPLYFGAGLRFLDEMRANQGNAAHLGFRVPVGIAFEFHHIPLDVFVEAALLIDFVHASGESVFGLNAGIGVRYWF